MNIHMTWSSKISLFPSPSLLYALHSYFPVFIFFRCPSSKKFSLMSRSGGLEQIQYVNDRLDITTCTGLPGLVSTCKKLPLKYHLIWSADGFEWTIHLSRIRFCSASINSFVWLASSSNESIGLSLWGGWKEKIHHISLKIRILWVFSQYNRLLKSMIPPRNPPRSHYFQLDRLNDSHYDKTLV